jgi:hypothetical protein
MVMRSHHYFLFVAPNRCCHAICGCAIYRHPDKNPEDATATAKFQAINNAYRRLTEADEVNSDDGFDEHDGSGAVRTLVIPSRYDRDFHTSQHA